ncbi:MAG: PTS sugar transporter subunit IIA, partial [Candidatus Eisenbacteria bacterium]|nr:PTS sugar transporter subunit IIA [Candidatus Eisenbacteria bacterium]
RCSSDECARRCGLKEGTRHMNLTDFTNPRLIDLAVPAGDKRDVIANMVGLLSTSANITDGAVLLSDVLAREELVTTGVGYGVAFPHAKSEAVRRVVFAVGRTVEGVDFGALDSQPVRLIFVIGAPREAEPSGIYLNLMARLSFLMKDEANRNALLTAESTAGVLKILDSVR